MDSDVHPVESLHPQHAPDGSLAAIDLSTWGIEPGYHDVRGEWHDTPPETLAAVAALLGAHGEDSAGGEDRTRSADPAGGAGRARPPGSGADSPVWVVRAGQPVDAAGEWELVLEDGATLRGAGRLPLDVPLGYHDLRRGDGEPLRLIVTPGRCHLPDGLRTWGWAVQLYAVRSSASWGIGDLGDLAALTAWAAGLGAGMTLLNPLHAALPGPSQEASPYYPSSRCWRNPLYLRVEDVPGAAGHPEMESLAAAGRALDRDRRIDRDAVWRLKRQVLEWAWDRFEDDGNFEKWRQRAGPALAGYARFAALTELHDGPWPRWPEGVRHPRGAGVPAAASRSRRRVGFHEWLQWLVDRQLERAGRPLDLVADLAVGVDPEGADAWLWQDCFALGARVGAPPDEFNVDGQDWGLPPFDPWRLRAARFEPFVQTVRAGLRHAGGLRVDHVMGLSRLWWIPPGARASDGVYVRYPLAELLDVLALESVRAQAFVVGEDLGTVEPAVRRELGERGVLSYRLLWFEPEPPGPAWPRQSLGAVTTHDLPTVAGLWTGADLAEQAALGLHPAGAGAAAIRDRVEGWLGLPDGASPAEVTVAVHRLLAGAPSMVLAATLDDALGVAERPNVPGTTAGLRPNWCLALPASLEEIMSDPVVAEVAHALRRTPGPP